MSMKLLLRENVQKLGRVGDIVSVKEGYGRNFLLPRNLAVEVTPANLKQIEAERKRRVEQEAQSVSEYKELATRLAEIDVTLKERVSGGDNLYGAVSAKEIVAALAEQGVNLDAGKLVLAEPIKTLGVHRVTVRFHPEVECELKVWVVEQKEAE